MSTKMATSQVISFRLSDTEISALEAQKVDGEEKASQTAQRLLRGLLGVSTAVDMGAIATAENIPGLEAFVLRVLEQQLGEKNKRLGESEHLGESVA